MLRSNLDLNRMYLVPFICLFCCGSAVTNNFLILVIVCVRAECPIDFATKNYSSITNVCHESNPDKVLCCSAFVNFTCQYVTYFNDQTTNCATTLFSYLSLAGNYSAELFSSLCQGSQQGLLCPIVPAPSPLPSSAFFCRPLKTSILVMFHFFFLFFGLDFIV